MTTRDGKVKPAVRYRRIDVLRGIARDNGLTSDDAREFGDPRKTSTWESLLWTFGLLPTKTDSQDQLTSSLDSLDTVIHSDYLHQSEYQSTSAVSDSFTFLEWVDLSQLIACAFASVGVIVLVLSMWQQINPLNLFPVRINIQIGVES